eukprot:34401-Prymnesium_polylepis.1
MLDHSLSTGGHTPTSHQQSNKQNKSKRSYKNDPKSAASNSAQHTRHRGNPRISVSSARMMAAPASRVRPTSHPA